jgi:hypothetical protein
VYLCDAVLSTSFSFDGLLAQSTMQEFSCKLYYMGKEPRITVRLFVHASSLKNWNMYYLHVISFDVFNSKFYYYMAFVIVLFVLLP